MTNKMDYDLIIIGSGPGGYVAAIRASQLKMKVAVVEKADVGGVCLNWGCIPTKSLLKSAGVINTFNKASEYGVTVTGDIKADFKAMISRSRQVANNMSKGIQYLFRKNNIKLINGSGRLAGNNQVEVQSGEGNKETISAENIIIATGARSKELPGMKQDGRKIIGYREALSLDRQPESMVIVGSGAIGSEFAWFYQSIGTKVTLVELLPAIIPGEDEEVSKQLERSFRKSGIKILSGSSVESVEKSSDRCIVTVGTKGKEVTLEADVVLSAAGITPNTRGIGLEEAGIRTEGENIIVDEYYRSSVPGIYAIGDVISGPALAHVASAEGIICVEKMAGRDVEPLDYKNIPSCIYTYPEVASCGMKEKEAREAGYEILTGKFPFTASGKASASGSKEGFVKLIFDAKYGELLGAHMIGDNVTEMISEIVMARKLETTGHEIIKAVHPHPTMSEAIMEAAAAAYGEVIHL